MKFLNLNKYTKATGRFLKIDGVDHAINAMETGQFIDITEAIKTTDTTDGAAQLKLVLKSIIDLVPTVNQEMLRGYTPEQLNEIAAFVRGENVDGAEEVAAALEGDELGK